MDTCIRSGCPLRQLYGIKPTATVTRNGVTLARAQTKPAMALMPGDIVELHVLPPGMAVEPGKQGIETQ